MEPDNTGARGVSEISRIFTPTPSPCWKRLFVLSHLGIVRAFTLGNLSRHKTLIKQVLKHGWVYLKLGTLSTKLIFDVHFLQILWKLREISLPGLALSSAVDGWCGLRGARRPTDSWLLPPAGAGDGGASPGPPGDVTRHTLWNTCHVSRGTNTTRGSESRSCVTHCELVTLLLNQEDCCHVSRVTCRGQCGRG